MKTILVFQSDLFVRNWPEEGHDVDSMPSWGKYCADFLMSGLKRKGALLCNAEPTQADGGWVVDLQIGNQRFSLFVQWTPLGQPPADYWAVQSEKIRGPISALFGKRTSTTELQPLCTLLDEIVREQNGITNIRWLTLEEFKDLYWPWVEFPRKSRNSVEVSIPFLAKGILPKRRRPSRNSNDLDAIAMWFFFCKQFECFHLELK